MMADSSGLQQSGVSAQSNKDNESESILNELVLESEGIADLRSSSSVEDASSNVCPDKARRSSILSRAGRSRVKKSVSFCSMPEDRRVSNGESIYLSNVTA